MRRGSHRRCRQSMFEQDSLVPARPIRLFERPEPIEAIAEVPDGPPVRFRWRHVLHEVAHAEGPERIAMEWWRDERRPRAHARLFPRREPRGRARLALPRRALRPRDAEPRWFLHGCSHDNVVVSVRSKPRASIVRAMPSLPSPPISPSCAAPRIRKSWSIARKQLGLAGLGIADRNSRRRRGARSYARRRKTGCLKHRGRRAARLRRRHARHPRLSAGPRRLGPAHAPALRSASAAPRRATAFSGCRICWNISKASISSSCRRRGSMRQSSHVLLAG